MNIKIYSVKEEKPPVDTYILRWQISDNEIFKVDFMVVEDDDGELYWSDSTKVYSTDYWSYGKINQF